MGGRFEGATNVLLQEIYTFAVPSVNVFGESQYFVLLATVVLAIDVIIRTSSLGNVLLFPGEFWRLCQWQLQA